MKALLVYLLLLALGLIVASAMLKPITDDMRARAKQAQQSATLLIGDYDAE